MSASLNGNLERGKPARETHATPEPGNPAPEDVRVNGYAQVLDMLRIADPQFRDSILRRIALRDPVLARNLRAELIEN